VPAGWAEVGSAASSGRPRGERVREYETTVIVQPEISSSGTETILEKLDSALEQGGSTRLMCADLGKRKLAYEIHKFHKGHYYTLSFVDEGQVIPDLERVLRMEESVLRFMTVMVDESVTDLEARVERGRNLEIEQEKRAVEKAEREADEARAREEVERLAAEAAKTEAAAAAAAATAATAAATAEAGSSESDADPQSAAAEDVKPVAAAGASEDAAPGALQSEENKESEKTAAGKDEAKDEAKADSEDGDKS
jgi:small subunit ribosomal protein S6